MSYTPSEGDLVSINYKAFDPKSKWTFVTLRNEGPGMPLYAEVVRHKYTRAVVPLSALSPTSPTVVPIETVAEFLDDDMVPPGTKERFLDKFEE